MTLYIDTADFTGVTIALGEKGSLQKETRVIDPHRSHETLGVLDRLLKRLQIPDPQLLIKKIVVNKGPGSYTGVRIGVVMGQALSLAWKVPVRYVKAEQMARLLSR